MSPGSGPSRRMVGGPAGDSGAAAAARSSDSSSAGLAPRRREREEEEPIARASPARPSPRRGGLRRARAGPLQQQLRHPAYARAWRSVRKLAQMETGGPKPPRQQVSVSLTTRARSQRTHARTHTRARSTTHTHTQMTRSDWASARAHTRRADERGAMFASRAFHHAAVYFIARVPPRSRVCIARAFQRPHSGRRQGASRKARKAREAREAAGRWDHDGQDGARRDKERAGACARARAGWGWQSGASGGRGRGGKWNPSARRAWQQHAREEERRLCGLGGARGALHGTQPSTCQPRARRPCAPVAVRMNEWLSSINRKPAHSVPNWQAPTSTGKPTGHRGAARGRVLGVMMVN